MEYGFHEAICCAGALHVSYNARGPTGCSKSFRLVWVVNNFCLDIHKGRVSLLFPGHFTTLLSVINSVNGTYFLSSFHLVFIHPPLILDPKSHRTRGNIKRPDKLPEPFPMAVPVEDLTPELLFDAIPALPAAQQKYDIYLAHDGWSHPDYQDRYEKVQNSDSEQEISCHFANIW